MKGPSVTFSNWSNGLGGDTNKHTHTQPHLEHSNPDNPSDCMLKLMKFVFFLKLKKLVGYKGLFPIKLSLGIALFEFWHHFLGQLRVETWR